MAYLFLMPANRIGHRMLGIGELEIPRGIITLSVFAPLSPLYPKEPVKLDPLWAGLCLVGAALFISAIAWVTAALPAPPSRADLAIAPLAHCHFRTCDWHFLIWVQGGPVT